PSGRFAANQAWLTLATLTHNLLRATGCLASVFHATARTGTLRRHLINIPARITRTARRITLRLPANWPWQHSYQALSTATGTRTACPPRPDNPDHSGHTGCDGRQSTTPTNQKHNQQQHPRTTNKPTGGSRINAPNGAFATASGDKCCRGVVSRAGAEGRFQCVDWGEGRLECVECTEGVLQHPGRRASPRPAAPIGAPARPRAVNATLTDLKSLNVAFTYFESTKDDSGP
ncbi:transposase, partial [Amycolatopsis sp. NPDC059020]|uniref:transposase n=1 Tax=unclassified Amycolatopsis TaxID=2618356 RepID=UPI00366F5B6F